VVEGLDGVGEDGIEQPRLVMDQIIPFSKKLMVKNATILPEFAA